ncbi:MAG: NAD-dependent epimerase/dehydratase family protein [Alphaproteobacteria bacterium]|nr:MAG: NAD-dependent epimerase/dehydratase family protein [Alphaproteobacteria bacterium]
MSDEPNAILVTGASGFVGRNLVAALAAVRRPFIATGHEAGEADATTDWSGMLNGARAVVHLAGRHVGDPQSFERDIEMTLNLARQAAALGIERFVFLSSIKVNGEVTEPGRVFSEADTPEPLDTYGQSKLRIEQALAEIDLPVTVIRAPLVYGPGVNGNFRKLINAVEQGWPLPLGAVENRRSMVAVGNLCDFIMRVVDEPGAVGETYVLADGDDMSTTELLRRLARSLNRPSRLLPVAPGLIEGGLRLAGLGGWADRLLCDLRVDIGKARALGWVPPLSSEDGLALVSRQPGDVR